MSLDVAIFKGSKSGDIVEFKGKCELGPTEVMVQITHSGVCGTDELFRFSDQGLGHEGVGIITRLGSLVDQVSEFKIGDRVGMGFFFKYCGYCKSCLTGHQNQCPNIEMFGRSNKDKGCFGTAVTRDVSAVFKIPDEISSEHAGPLMCGGTSVWNPLYEEGARPGDRVGIVGIGGLGHLAIQFASKMGLEAVAFSSSESKKEEAIKFGASEFHVIGHVNMTELAKLNFLLVTSNALLDFSTYFPALAPGAKIVPLTFSFDNLQIPNYQLQELGARVIGSALGPTASVQSMLMFAAKNNIQPQIEKFPMTQAGITEAMQKLKNGEMRYRGVVVV